MQISENHMMSPFCACVLQQSAATLAGSRGLSEPASVEIRDGGPHCRCGEQPDEPVLRHTGARILAGYMAGGSFSKRSHDRCRETA